MFHWGPGIFITVKLGMPGSLTTQVVEGEGLARGNCRQGT